MYYNSIKLIVCGVLLNGVYICVHVVLLVAHYQFGQYSLQPLNFRTSTKCTVCIHLTEVTIASLTLSTVHQVILFYVSLSTI